MTDLCVWIYFMFLIPGVLATMLIVAASQVVRAVFGSDNDFPTTEIIIF